MAPLDVPHHWKQIKQFTKFEMADVEDPGEDLIDSEEEVDDSDTEETTSQLNVSDVEEVIAFVLQGNISEDESVEIHLSSDEETDTDESFTYHPLLEENNCSTPLRQNVPDARRRLFECSSGEEDDEDGIEYL